MITYTNCTPLSSITIMNFSRRKRAAACFLTAIGPVMILNYHTRCQTRKAIIDYHEEFEQVQTE